CQRIAQAPHNLRLVPEISSPYRNVELKLPPPFAAERVHVLSAPRCRLVSAIDIGGDFQQVLELRRHILEKPLVQVLDFQSHVIAAPLPGPQRQRKHPRSFCSTAARLQPTARNDVLTLHPPSLAPLALGGSYPARTSQISRP